jgi:hypothetical protein
MRGEPQPVIDFHTGKEMTHWDVFEEEEDYLERLNLLEDWERAKLEEEKIPLRNMGSENSFS